MTKHEFLQAAAAQFAHEWFSRYFLELSLPDSLDELALATVYAAAVRPQLPVKTRTLPELLVDLQKHIEYYGSVSQTPKTRLDRVIDGCLLASTFSRQQELNPWS